MPRPEAHPGSGGGDVDQYHRSTVPGNAPVAAASLDWLEVPLHQSEALRVVRALWRQGPGSGLAVFAVRFNDAEFDPAYFGKSRMHVPAAVQQSVRRRQAEFFYGRMCVRHALRELGTVNPETAVDIGPRRAPSWPPGIVGSISHCSGLAGAVVLASSACRGIGIDIEEIVNSESAAHLARFVVDAGELRYLDAVGGLSLATKLTIVFSAKESFFKALSETVGRIFEFDAIKVRQIDLRHGTVDFVVSGMLCPEFRPGDSCRSQFALGTNHVVSSFRW